MLYPDLRELIFIRLHALFFFNVPECPLQSSHVVPFCGFSCLTKKCPSGVHTQGFLLVVTLICIIRVVAPVSWYMTTQVL